MANLTTRVARELSPLFGRDPVFTLREEMDDLFDRVMGPLDRKWLTPLTVPSFDLAETDDNIEICMDLPGLKADDIDIDVTGRSVRISGKREEEKEEKGKTFHRVERHSGSFSRSITLPCAVEEDKVAADYQDGVLKVTLPKAAEAKTHKVKVKSNGS